jgi:hypothetical protein
MSERDEKTRVAGLALFLVALAFCWLVLDEIDLTLKRDAICDLQRRVGQLESERR